MDVVYSKPLADYQKHIQNGIWSAIHLMGKRAVTDLSNPDPDHLKKAYATFFRSFCSGMGCHCESHCIEMLKFGNELCPENFFDKEDGCFIHSWACHNAVNGRLGKVRPSYEEVKTLYYSKQKSGGIKPCSAPEETEKIKNVRSTFPNLFKNEVPKSSFKFVSI